ncbi:hypothetical protein AB4043_11415, partial [Terriglobus sp. YAF25]
NTQDPTQGRLLQYTYVPGDVGAPSFPNVSTTPNPAAKISYTLMRPGIQNAYAQQMSLGLEQQLARATTLGLSYQHTRGLHLLSSVNRNINLDGTRPDNSRGNVRYYDSLFDSYYDGFAVSLVQRPVSWGSARVSYTWSKAINNISEFFFSSPINNFDLNVDRGRSDDDQRHRLVFDFSVHSPTSHTSTVMGHLTHGWQFGGVLQYYSRLPFNIVTGGQTKQQTTQRPCTGGYSLSATNPCTEGLAGAVIGRNTGVGFDFFGMNARLNRTIALTDRVHLEGIAEAFNLLNHRNDMLPNGTWGTGAYPTTSSSTFGAANGVGDPRSIQLAARISF